MHPSGLFFTDPPTQSNLCKRSSSALQMANYWEPSKKILNDPTKFLDSLLTYDKDNIGDSVIRKVEPYIQVKLVLGLEAVCKGNSDSWSAFTQTVV